MGGALAAEHVIMPMLVNASTLKANRAVSRGRRGAHAWA